MTEVKHTPRPWKLGKNDGNIVQHIYDADGTWIAYTRSPDAMPCEVTTANADFIVRACNSHYELVEALALAADRLELSAKRLGGSYEKETEMYVLEARASVAKAKGAA